MLNGRDYFLLFLKFLKKECVFLNSIDFGDNIIDK